MRFHSAFSTSFSSFVMKSTTWCFVASAHAWLEAPWMEAITLLASFLDVTFVNRNHITKVPVESISVGGQNNTPIPYRSMTLLWSLCNQRMTVDKILRLIKAIVDDDGDIAGMMSVDVDILLHAACISSARGRSIVGDSNNSSTMTTSSGGEIFVGLAGPAGSGGNSPLVVTGGKSFISVTAGTPSIAAVTASDFISNESWVSSCLLTTNSDDGCRRWFLWVPLIVLCGGITGACRSSVPGCCRSWVISCLSVFDASTTANLILLGFVTYLSSLAFKDGFLYFVWASRGFVTWGITVSLNRGRSVLPMFDCGRMENEVERHSELCSARQAKINFGHRAAN